jgi:hypothetical protein
MCCDARYDWRRAGCGGRVAPWLDNVVPSGTDPRNCVMDEHRDRCCSVNCRCTGKRFPAGGPSTDLSI